MVWISLHGGASADLSRLVLRVHIQPLFVPINHISESAPPPLPPHPPPWAHAEGASHHLGYGRPASHPSMLLASVATRERRFLTHVDSGSLALPVKCFRSLLAALLPHDATARQRNGWPSLTTMRGFLLLPFPHPQERKQAGVERKRLQDLIEQGLR